jgi:hypothetical protein
VGAAGCGVKTAAHIHYRVCIRPSMSYIESSFDREPVHSSSDSEDL